MQARCLGFGGLLAGGGFSCWCPGQREATVCHKPRRCNSTTPQTQHLIILEVRNPTASHGTQIQVWAGPSAPGGPGKTRRPSPVPETHTCGPPSPAPASCASDACFRDLCSNSGPPASLFHADNPGSFLVSGQCFPQLQSCPCCGGVTHSQSQGLRRGHFREPHSADHTHGPGPAGLQIRQTISAPLWEGSWSVQNPRTQGSAPKPSARPMGSVRLGKETEAGSRVSSVQS